MAFDDGFEIPLHRSLTQPMMFAGLPRGLGLMLWTSTAAFGLGLHQIWVVPVALLLHAVLSAAAKRDPYFLDVFLRALRAGRRLDP
jgi:type IV secretory pathway TrbD component